MVCFDKSSSMKGSCFPDMMVKPAEEKKVYTTTELAKLIETLKENPRLDVFRAIYTKSFSLRSKVLDELCRIDEGFKQIDKSTSLISILSQEPKNPPLFYSEFEQTPKPRVSIKLPSLNGDLQIFVHTVTGQTKVMNIDASYTVQQLKWLINHKSSRDLSVEMTLMYGGKILDNSLTLSQYNVQKDSTIWENFVFDNSIYDLTFVDNIGWGQKD